MRRRGVHIRLPKPKTADYMISPEESIIESKNMVSNLEKRLVISRTAKTFCAMCILFS